MSRTYFGGLDGQSPIQAPSTADWSTVNPPEVVKAAWDWENQHRAAQREQEMLARSGSIDETAKTVAAATQFQGMRSYQQDLANGLPAAEALARNAPMMFFSKPTAAASAAKGAQAKTVNAGGVLYQVGPDGKAVALTPERTAKTEVVDINGQKVSRVTQPGGNIVERVIRPPVNEAEKDLRSRISRAQLDLDKATAETAKYSATQPETIPATKPWFGKPTEARTVERMVYDKQKAAEAKAAQDAAQLRLDTLQKQMQGLGQSRPEGTNRVSAPNATPAAHGYIPGKRYGNLRFKGGDPNSETSWEQVQ